MSEQTAQPASDHLDIHDVERRVKAIFIGSVGNLVEWYDFYAYTAFALYFAPAFFPHSDPVVQQLNAAVLFAATFLMRPLGGWLFGWLADKHGRKTSMVASVLLMCGGSLMIALLPTYATIGTAAPALLLVARLAQGLSVGGEYGTAATYMSEVAGKGNRGFYSSFQYVTLIGGQLLALLVLIVLQATLSVEQIKEWGWRIPFLLGAVAAVVAMYLRRSLEETHSGGHKEAGSLKLLLPHKKAVLITFGLTMGGSLYFYTFTTYMQKYLVNTAKMSATTVSTVMTVCLVVFMCLQPLFGALSDRIGRRNNLLFFGSLAVLGAVPLLTMLGSVGSTPMAVVLIMTSLLIACFYTSISGVVKAELFPPDVRALGVGLPYAIANAMFGGTAEYVALSMKAGGNEQLFPWYVTAVVAVALVACWLMPDTRKHGYLDGDGRV